MEARGGTCRTMVARLGIAALLAVASLGGGCAAPGAAARPGEPPAEPVSVRLPVGTPLKIEQTVPPTGAEQSIAPVEIEEGRARSLKLFQVDFGQEKTGPAAEGETPGP